MYTEWEEDIYLTQKHGKYGNSKHYW